MGTKSNFPTSWLTIRPKIIGVAVFLATLLLFSLIIYQEYSLSKDDEKQKETEVLAVIEQNIEQSLKNSYMAALTIALTIDDEGKPHNFEQIAGTILSKNPTIGSVQLVPNGIISYVYPYKSNQKALELDILKDSYSKEEANEAIMDRNMRFAGPIKLKQGGEVVVGRLPIFIQNKFWGFSVVIMDMKDFLANAGIDQFTEMGFKFKWSKHKTNSSQETFFYGETNSYDVKQASKVYIKDGNWSIYIYSTNKEHLLLSLLPLLIVALLISILIGFFTCNFLQQPLRLQRELEAQAVQLFNSEQKFETIFNLAPIGIVHVSAENFKFITANEYFLNKLGLSLEELKKITFDAVWREPEDLTKLLERGGRVETDFIHTKEDDTSLRVKITWLKNKNKPNYIFTVDDITERYKTQSDLAELKSRMEMAAQIAQLGYWEWNADTNEILWTDAMYEICKVSKDTKLTAEFVFSRIHPSDVGRYIECSKLLLNGKDCKPYEIRILAPDGTYIYVLGHFESEKNSEGRLAKIKGTLIDISGEKRIKEELNQSYDMVLNQNQRLINFSYIVSHNLRSHASNIQSLAHLLFEMDHTQEQKEMFNMLDSVSKALDETLFDLNDVINIQNNVQISIENILVKNYIERVLKSLQIEIFQKNAQIHINVPAETKINFNPAYFESILFNFMSNSLKYCHPERSPIIHLDYLVLKDRFVLQIKDNGIGIDLEKNGDKLFGMYKTFSKNADSKGLGLFISKSQMEALGGEITVESELGKGSIFNLCFN
ncbi:ATP-binding protein [Mesonia ostreae]|uniref:histidine kinase n=1 Tax=Mesonia ostreae TaxID=861110 RepID=A0ABU2KKK5_9FLAO|nr:ATP-binding protein [Mesonia ostreae]MDT0295240.1 ATP-binding protein [Mesonia ostreae]